MILSINRDIFLEKLSFSSRFTSSKLSSLSSLQGVLIKGEKNILHFFATNLNSFYHTRQKIENEREFQIIVEPKKIIEFLSLLPSGKIDLDIKEKVLKVSQGKIKGEFPLFATEEFPYPPKITGKPQKIKAEFFLKSLPLVLFSASSDESRPVLSGLNFTSRDDDLIIVATDGFRLSLLRLKKEIDIPQMIIPASFVAEVVHLADKEKDIVFNYSTEEKTVLFQIGEHDLYSRMIEGEYPPFEKVIPVEKKTGATVDKEELLRGVKLVGIFAREASNIVILDIKSDGISLYPKTGKDSGTSTFQEGVVDGDGMIVAFNYKFILDFLNETDAKKITIELLRPDAPTVFKSDKNPEFLHIIMPVRIQE